MGQNRRIDQQPIEATPEELAAALAHIRGARVARLPTVGELLKAVELGVMDKAEARQALGLPPRRTRRGRTEGNERQPRAGGRFAPKEE